MAKQSKKKQSKSQKAQFTGYKADNTALKNKARRLAKHVKNHPGDDQASKSVASGHTRKAPGSYPPARKPEGFQVIGTKKVKSKRTGNMVEVPIFKLFLPERHAGFLSKDIKHARSSQFFKMEERVVQTLRGLKQTLAA